MTPGGPEASPPSGHAHTAHGRRPAPGLPEQTGADSRFPSQQLLLRSECAQGGLPPSWPGLRPPSHLPSPLRSTGAALPWDDAGPLREGSRLYSYLPRGQHHCPETTQPTTSPHRCPGLGGSAVLPLPPAQPRPLLVVCSHQSRAGGLGRRRGGGTCRRRLGPHAGQSTCACWGWNGLVPTRAAVGSRTFLSLPAWERGALASVPPLTRGLTLSWAGCGLGGRADRGRPRGLPWGAGL